MTGPAARDPLPGEPEHRQRWTDAAITPEQVAEAKAWFRDPARPDRVDWIQYPPSGVLGNAQRHAATLVRAALAAETETDTEYRAVLLCDESVTWGVTGFTAHRESDPDVRFESRQVTTTRTETPWTEQR